MALVTSVDQLIALRIAMALLSGGLFTLAYTVTGLSLPSAKVGMAYGVLGSFSSFGSSLSPMSLGLISSISLRAVFVAGALLMVAALACVLLASRAQQSVTEEEAAQTGG